MDLFLLGVLLSLMLQSFNDAFNFFVKGAIDRFFRAASPKTRKIALWLGLALFAVIALEALMR